MKTHLSYLTVIAVLLAPAYVQARTTLNDMADRFAEARVGISKAEAAEYVIVRQSSPDHLKTPLPHKKVAYVDDLGGE